MESPTAAVAFSSGRSYGDAELQEDVAMTIRIAIAPLGALLLTVASCGGSPPPATQSSTAAETTAEATAASQDMVPPPTDDAAAALAARDRELAAREAELSFKEREEALQRREAELAARETAAKAPAKAPTPARPATAQRPAPEAKPAVAKKPPAPLTVPAGTSLPVQIFAGVTTKTAQVGDRFEGRIGSDIMVGERVAIPAGTAVQGSVTRAFSGSQKIGGTPQLGLVLDRLVLSAGRTVPLNATFQQEGKRESGRDAAKIGGSTAVGAVLGHQIDDDKGKVIGGLVGAAAGAYAAKKTGGDIVLASDSAATFSLTAPIEVSAR